MTGDQLIVLGLLAAAFIAGWVAGTAREGREGRSRPDHGEDATRGQPRPTGVKTEGRRADAQAALEASRRALNRVIARYHQAVTAWLQDEPPATTSEPLASEVLELADEMESASTHLNGTSAQQVRSTALQLRRLGAELSSNPQGELAPVLDKLEQNLVAATVTFSKARRFSRTTTTSDRAPSALDEAERPAAIQRS
jgi:hypothetical protein